MHTDPGRDAEYEATRSALAAMLVDKNMKGPRRRRRARAEGAALVVSGGVNHGTIAHTVVMQAAEHGGPYLTDSQQRELVMRLRIAGETQGLLGVLLRAMGVPTISLIPMSRWAEAWRWAGELADLAATAQMMVAEGRSSPG